MHLTRALTSLLAFNQRVPPDERQAPKSVLNHLGKPFKAPETPFSADLPDKLSRVEFIETDVLPSVYALSDPHIDYPANKDRLLALKPEDYPNSVLMLPGDISDDLQKIKDCLLALKTVFSEIIYIPGNHETWVSNEEDKKAGINSFQKFEAVMNMCEEIGIHTSPLHFISEAESLTIVPLFSWYVKQEGGANSFFQPRSFKNHPAARWADDTKCNWLEGLGTDQIDALFDELNNKVIESINTIPKTGDHLQHVISMSHFVPDQRLTYASKEKNAHMKVKPRIRFNFSNVAGTKRLWSRLIEIGTKLHVYGHQHRKRARVLSADDERKMHELMTDTLVREFVKGILFINAAVGNPREVEKGITQDVPTQVFPLITDTTYLNWLAHDLSMADDELKLEISKMIDQFDDSWPTVLTEKDLN